MKPVFPDYMFAATNINAHFAFIARYLDVKHPATSCFMEIQDVRLINSRDKVSGEAICIIWGFFINLWV